jgi:branched-subunit amino acid transport protein
MTHINDNTIWDYIEGDLDAQTNDSIGKHLEICATCKAGYEVILGLHKELYEVQEEVAPSMGFSRNVLLQIEKNKQIDLKSRFWMSFTKIALLSAICIAILLSFGMILNQTPEMTVNSALVNKVILPIISTCLVLWVLYGLDLVLKRKYGEIV